MDKAITQEFITILNKVRKLMNKCHPKEMVHPGEFMMLSTIHTCMEDKSDNQLKDPGVMVSELSEKVHSTKSATSKMLNNLEEKGYIMRVSSNKDRRIVYIRLSESGETIIKEAFKKLDNFVDGTIKRMGKEDAKDLIRILNKFYQAMYDELSEELVNKE